MRRPRVPAARALHADPDSTMPAAPEASPAPPPEPRATSPRSPPPWALAAAVAILAVGAYAGALRGAFVFDDVAWIVKNDTLLDLRNFLASSVAYRELPNRFVPYLTLALNHAIGGLDPSGYRALNVAVHVANALLVFALVRETFRTPRLRASALAPWSGSVAFLAAALFATHPLQTQAVTYVVQRFTSMAALFYLGAVVAWARWRLRCADATCGAARRALSLGGALALALLAMKSKEIAITLPATLLVYEAAFFGRPARRVALALAAVAAIAATIPLAWVRLDAPVAGTVADASSGTRVQTRMSRLAYARTQVAVLGEYARLLAVPVGQNVDHDVAPVESLLEPRALAALLALAAIVALAIAAARRALRRSAHAADPAALLAAFGVAWFFVTISVESSFIPIVDVMVEHRVYLPSAGALVAIATSLALVARRLAPSRAPALVVVAGAVLGLGLGAATWARNVVWRSDAALWADAASKSPAKSRPHTNLGVALVERGDLREGIAQLRLGIALDPGNGDAHGNLGMALVRAGRAAEAMPHLLVAVELAPRQATFRTGLGVALLESGRGGDAIAQHRRALELRPRFPDALSNLGVACFRQGLVDEAIERFREAIALDPEHADAHYNLGIALGRQGKLDEAAAEMREGMRLRARTAAGR